MDYIASRKKAATKIIKAGRSVTLFIPASAGTYDPVTGETTGATAEQNIAVHAVGESYLDSEVNGTSIQSNDQKLMMAALDDSGAVLPKPTTADTIIMGGTTYAIVHVQPTEPGDVAILYEVQIRG